ncbi:MAG: DegV family protein [Oscillospiraceae bacterium]|nr:DegV family protein [Oscillospiraceae bacterium]
MEKIKIITDSASDVPLEYEKSYEIEIIPFEISLDGENYLERRDFCEKEFYKILEKSEGMPVTNQIMPHRFLQIFTHFFNRGYTDIIYISINAKGSATNQNAHTAAKEFFEAHPDSINKFNIDIIDGGTYSYGYGYAVTLAAQKAKLSVPKAEIIAFINDWIGHVRVFLAPYSLKYAKKSGRISAAAAFAGELLGIRPIIIFEDGESRIIDKVRHDKNVIPAIIKNAKSRMIPQTPYVVVLGDMDDKNEEMIEQCKKSFGYEPAEILPVGATIACNSGSKIVALAIKSQL